MAALADKYIHVVGTCLNPKTKTNTKPKNNSKTHPGIQEILIFYFPIAQFIVISESETPPEAVQNLTSATVWCRQARTLCGPWAL